MRSYEVTAVEHTVEARGRLGHLGLRLKRELDGGASLPKILRLEPEEDVNHVPPESVRNINATIRKIEESPRFDMGDWAYCLKAHAIKAMGKGCIETILVPGQNVTDFLGMPSEDGWLLFRQGHLTRHEVVTLLETFRDTGKLEYREPTDERCE